MSVTLAIETATEACSVALQNGEDIFERHELIPRQHNRRLFGLLEELFEDANLTPGDLDAVSYGAGPGSFTGLRIAASLAQGICFSRQIPAVPVSTLAVIAQTALGQNLIADSAKALVLLDARVNEVYAAVVEFRNGSAALLEGPWVAPPAELGCDISAGLHLLTCGATDSSQLNPSLQESIFQSSSAVYPRARFMLPLAVPDTLWQDAHQVQPDYVQEEISWKKLSEQGVSR
jgi:tRNA threonylcarbamoyladenosine biosynthesis protein TsaB